MILQLQLPSHDEAIALNRVRWAEVHADAALAAIPNRIETNVWGQIIMTPPASEAHSRKQSEIMFLLRTLLSGVALVECPVSTADGVRAVDVAWYSKDRHAKVRNQLACEFAPEICVEVLSPSNTTCEIQAKFQLYFAAGAIECWTCDLEGHMTYYNSADPDTPLTQSKLCPQFPNTITD